MINTHLKFEAKIPNGTKVVAFKRNCTKFLSLKVNLTLKIKVKVNSFPTRLRYFGLSMNSLSVKAKFQKGQFKS